MLLDLRLAYALIHACPDKCMLFKGIGSNHLKNCTKCYKLRFKKKRKSLVLAKALRYFLLIPCL